MPNGEAIELTAQYTGDAIEFRSSRTRRPGAYSFRIGLESKSIPFQVKREAEESDLTRLNHAAWQRITIATTANTSPAEVSQSTASQSDPAWPFLLILLIGLITAELVLSGAMAAERFGSAGIPEYSEMDAPMLGTTLSNSFDRNHTTTSQSDDPDVRSAAVTSREVVER